MKASMLLLLLLLLVASVAHAKPPPSGTYTLTLLDKPPVYHRFHSGQQPASCRLAANLPVPERVVIKYSPGSIVVNGESWGDGGFTGGSAGNQIESPMKVAFDPAPSQNLRIEVVFAARQPRAAGYLVVTELEGDVDTCSVMHELGGRYTR